MGTGSRARLLLGFSFLNLGAQAAWPIKTIDLTNDGDDCDTSTEQYLHVEAYDFHDHPKFTMRWRQVTGPCGEAVDDSDLLSWEASYDGSRKHFDDVPPEAGDAGRVQLNLYVCSPFGEYELDMDIESYSDEGSTLQQRTSWQIKNGPDEHHIWDTVNTDLANDEYYSPTVPGEYTWPFEGATDYYSTFVAGPFPPLECTFSAPTGTDLVGCFADSSSDPLLHSDELVRNMRGPGGMTAQICSDFCTGYDYFGLEFGRQCFCGTAEEFEENPVASDRCGVSTSSLCTGDPTTACGGYNAISVYQRTEYSMVGCFQDDKESRIMRPKGSASVMSAEVCYGRCNDGINNHFGTQYARECWCGVDPVLTKNGEMMASDECDMQCAGTTSGEYCGGYDKMTAYRIHYERPVGPDYIGCYADGPHRAMNAAGKHLVVDMTNEVCIAYCAGHGYAYAGTQYSVECWCGDSFDRYGEIPDTLCSYPCEGDAEQMCGGSYALSVYSTD